MKVLLCHNYYQQRGGEDESFEAEARTLEEFGHEVVTYTRHNDAIHEMGRLDVASQTLWSRKTYSELRRLIREDAYNGVHIADAIARRMLRSGDV